MYFLETLPCDILINICTELNVKSIISLCYTCDYMLTFIKNKQYILKDKLKHTQFNLECLDFKELALLSQFNLDSHFALCQDKSIILKDGELYMCGFNEGKCVQFEKFKLDNNIIISQLFCTKDGFTISDSAGKLYFYYDKNRELVNIYDDYIVNNNKIYLNHYLYLLNASLVSSMSIAYIKGNYFISADMKLYCNINDPILINTPEKIIREQNQMYI